MSDENTGRPERKQRWFQFSLRGLMLLVLLTALWLARQVDQARAQREAVALVQRLGGSVAYDYEYDARAFRLPNAQPWTPQWLRGLFGHDFLHDVAWVHLADTDVTDRDLLVLKNLHALRGLCLSGTRVTDQGLAHVSHLTSMQRLWLYDTQVTDAGLQHLAQMKKLEELVLSRPITDRGLQHLRGLAQLTSLELWGSGFSDEGLRQLAGLKRLKFLKIIGTRATLAGQRELKSAFPRWLAIDDGSFNAWCFGQAKLTPARVDLPTRD